MGGLVETLQLKWDNERRQREQQGLPCFGRRYRGYHPPPLLPTVELDASLEPVRATRHGVCTCCQGRISVGEAVVSADGIQWIHLLCAERESWPIA